MSWIRRFLLWRYGRQRRQGYKLDVRHYRSGFGPGFFSYMGYMRFWRTRNDRSFAPKRMFAPLRWFLILIVAAGLIWLMIESIYALRLF